LVNGAGTRGEVSVSLRAEMHIFEPSDVKRHPLSFSISLRGTAMTPVFKRVLGPERFEQIDRIVAGAMQRYGVRVLRYALAVVFIWFGILKPLGLSPAEALVKRTVYFLPADVFFPILGWWEVAIGAALLFRPLVRLALFLLFAQMVGTFLPLVVLPEVVWTNFPFALTTEGQYIIKNLVLIGAALVVGGTVREESTPARQL
jgi:uncharacterized membrane protein YkgB